MNELNLTGKVAVITGGAGIICSTLAKSLAAQGVKTVILDLNKEAAVEVAKAIEKEFRTPSLGLPANVLDKASLEAAKKEVHDKFGPIDILINGAGGNNPKATTNPEQTFFDIPTEAIQFVSNLNLIGTILPSQIFGKAMVAQKEGIILNVSSMNAFRPLTRIPAYSAAKAAISNFTQWLAVHMAQEYTPNIRVNAIAPGFFLTEQNRFLLTDKATGELTARGKKILDHTPAGRFGAPEDLLGGMLWLLSPASKFVTGIVLPIDGGFSAYSGV